MPHGQKKIAFAFKLRVMGLGILAVAAGAVNPGSARADSDRALSPEIDRRIGEVQKQCGEVIDWSKTSCRTAALPDPMYEVHRRDRIEAQIEHSSGFSVPATLLTGHFKQSEKVKLAYQTLSELLQAIQRENNLSECQSACLVTCATSHFATYDQSKRYGSMGLSLDRILTTGLGVCTDYAHLANNLGRDLGLKTRAVIGGQGEHAFLGVTVNGNDYYMEPQNSACVFLR